jgi:hypothetical protein
MIAKVRRRVISLESVVMISNADEQQRADM